uniref:Uncharacterized protein n=2 Tax=Acrobeloides nanus TaxID=290746 RepID=A0A914DHI5_9BILA
MEEFKDLRPDQAIDHTDMQSRDFNEGPGEVDMLIGFFFMNGACIVFFLMFGMCVICSCMRRRPRLFRQKEDKKTPPPTSSSNTSQSTKLLPNIQRVPSPVITSPAVKSSFKSFVSRSMQNPDFYKINDDEKKGEENDETRKASTNSKKDRKASVTSVKDSNPAVKLLRRCSNSFKECRIEIEEENLPMAQSASYPVKIHVECTDASIQPLLPHSHTYTSSNHNYKNGHQQDISYNREHASKASPDPVEDVVETVSLDMVMNEPPSIVRQNLLGPLTFDDLYYT